MGKRFSPEGEKVTRGRLEYESGGSEYPARFFQIPGLAPIAFFGENSETHLSKNRGIEGVKGEKSEKGMKGL